MHVETWQFYYLKLLYYNHIPKWQDISRKNFNNLNIKNNLKRYIILHIK